MYFAGLWKCISKRLQFSLWEESTLSVLIGRKCAELIGSSTVRLVGAKAMEWTQVKFKVPYPRNWELIMG